MAKKFIKSNENTVSAEDRALNTFADMLIAKIESIKNDWKKPWFTEGSIAWPTNIDGREYNGMNTFMLAMLCEEKGYKLPVFATCNRIDALNYKIVNGKRIPLTDKNGDKLPLVHVLKGEKSFPVFLTNFFIKDANGNRITKEEYDNLEHESQKDYEVHPNMKVYNVFAIEQTNIAEARPELYAKIQERAGQVKPMELNDGVSFSFPAFDDMVTTGGWVCPIDVMHQDKAAYNIKKDRIILPEKSQFKDGESYYGTAFHECIHSTGHKDRLNRNLEGGHFGDHAYATEELIAEMGSALTAHRYGFFHVTSEESCAYIKCWLKNLKQEPSYVKRLLLDVKHATYMLTQKIGIIE